MNDISPNHFKTRKLKRSLRKIKHQKGRVIPSQNITRKTLGKKLREGYRRLCGAHFHQLCYSPRSVGQSRWDRMALFPRRGLSNSQLTFLHNLQHCGWVWVEEFPVANFIFLSQCVKITKVAQPNTKYVRPDPTDD